MLRTREKGIDSCGLRKEHIKGAKSELLAQCYYLDRGYQVFTPVVQQGWVDFIVYKDGKTLRIQVKTATWTYSNKHCNHGYLQVRTNSTNKYQEELFNKYDILLIIKDNKIWEIPSKEIKSNNISLESTNPNSKKEYKWDKYLKQTVDQHEKPCYNI